MATRDHIIGALWIASVVFWGATMFFFGTGGTFDTQEAFKHSVMDGVNAHGTLADAFFAGQLHLIPSPPEGLLELEDPFRPKKTDKFRDRGNPRVHDLVLFEERLYLYHSPVPTLTMSMPSKLIFGRYPHDFAMVFTYMLGAYAIATLILTRIYRRHFADHPLATYFFALQAIGFGSFLLTELGETNFHMSTLTSGIFFLTAGLYALYDGLVFDEKMRRYKLFAAACLLGLGVWSRPINFLWVSAVAAASIALITRRRGFGRNTVGLAAALAVPLVLTASLMMAYNYARFGDPTEVGTRYQMAAHHPAFTVSSSSNILPGIRAFLLSAPKVTNEYPFVHLKMRRADTSPEYLKPKGFYYYKNVFNLAYVSPYLLGLLILPIAAAAAIKKKRADAWKIFIPLTLLAAVFGSLAVIFIFPFAVTRYMLDYSTAALLLSSIAWFIGFDALKRCKHPQAKWALVSLYAIMIALAVATILLNVLMATNQQTMRGHERAGQLIESVLRWWLEPLVRALVGG